MYVLKRQVTMHRGIATLLAIALVLWAVGVHMFTVAEAAALSSVKDTLTDSNPSSVSDHEIQWVQTTAVGNSEDITITFPSAFTGTSTIAVGDIDLLVNGSQESVVDAAATSTQWTFSWAGDVMTLAGNTGTAIGSTATVTVRIGTNAGGTNQLINPATAPLSYEIDIATGPGPVDTGHARVAIIDNVLVTADVPTSLTFTVSGTTTATGVNGTSTTEVSTSNTLPFGTLADGQIKTLAQDLTVATNARNGYIVTVEQDGPLASTVGADIDSFIDAADTDSPATWVAPSNDIADENTWGHWGLTTSDGNLQGAGEDFLVSEWIGITTSPRVIMAHDGPADGVTHTPTAGVAGDDAGRTTVGYQIEITALQEAGDDYSTVLTYIATPTF